MGVCLRARERLCVAVCRIKDAGKGGGGEGLAFGGGQPVGPASSFGRRVAEAAGAQNSSSVAPPARLPIHEAASSSPVPSIRHHGKGNSPSSALALEPQRLLYVLSHRGLFKGGGVTEGGGIPHRRERYNVCPQWCRDTGTVTRVRHHLLC